MTLLKSIVVCLVLANVGYYLWARGIAQSGDGPPPAATSTLRLASEAGDAGRVSGAEAADAVVGAAGSGAGNVGADGADGGNGSAPDLAGLAGSGSAATLPLLTNAQRCISVGPFRDVSEAARAAATLRAGHYDPRQRVADGEVWAGVWVYLPIPASRSAAEQILSKLKSGGIEDALEMPGPNEGSVISLGLFSEPKRAQARVARAQALGFNPATADRKRTGNVYWIDIDLKPTDGLLKASDLQGEAGRIVRLEVKGCPQPSGAAS